MEHNSIIVLFSGNGSNLQAINRKCEYAFVQSTLTDQPEAYGVTRADNAGIPTMFNVQSPSQTRDDYSGLLGLQLSILNPRLVVLAGFMKILSPSFFLYFHDKQVINIHPSLLPKHKGLNTHQRVLDAGDEEHGITIHYVNEELDSGPIIWQSSYFVQPEDTVETLQTKGHELEHKWYPWVIDQIVKGNM